MSRQKNKGFVSHALKPISIGPSGSLDSLPLNCGWDKLPSKNLCIKKDGKVIEKKRGFKT